jgi:hypothetical protein
MTIPKMLSTLFPGPPPDGGPATVANVLAHPSPENDEWLLWFLAEPVLESGQGV